MKLEPRKTNFEGKEIYCGLDVHDKSWEVQILTANTTQKRIHLHPPTSEALQQYLLRHYPNGRYLCAYEAGFSGFWISEQLNALNIETHIIHAADIPTTDREKRFKTDKIDCLKIAKALRSGDFEGIYQPPKVLQMDRSLVRCREKFSRNSTRAKNRIRSHLKFYGLNRTLDVDKYWSRRMINTLTTHADEKNDQALKLYLESLKNERSSRLQALRAIRSLAREPRYRSNVDLIRSISGLGLINSMVFLTEVGSIERFKSLDHLISYIGFAPTSNSSGEKESKGQLSKRGNTFLRTAMIQSSWIAIRYDPSMAMAYESYKARGLPSQKAIVKIARKLVNRIRYVLLNREMYEVK